MSVHLSTLVDFVNKFIRYRSIHRIIETIKIVTEMVSTTVFLFCCEEIILVQQNSQRMS